MGQPGNRVGFARPCRVLDQVLLTSPLLSHRGQQILNHFPLVIARKDHRLFLLLPPQLILFHLDLKVQIATQYPQEVIRLQDLLPQITGSNALLTIHWQGLIIARPTLTGALVEWQEESRVARQFSGHRHLELIHCKVHQRPAAKTQ
ncbi:hypothetical protein D3C76_1188790 [compost metagenome]